MRVHGLVGSWSVGSALLVSLLVVGLRVPSFAAAQAMIGAPPAVGVQGLSDGRGYELVSPAEKPGGDGGVLPLTNIYEEYGPFQSSADGQSVTYLGEAFFEPNEGGVNQYTSSRSAQGWTTSSVSPATSAPTPEPFANRLTAYSQDLSRSVHTSNQSLTQSQLPAGYALGHKGLPAGYADLWLFDAATKTVEPLVTATPPNRDAEEFKIEFAGASADYSRIFFQANDVLASGANDGGYGAFNLYEWNDGHLRLVNVLENGTSPSPAFYGTTAEEEQGDFENVVSSDGSRVIWSDLADGTLYSSEVGAEPVQLDRSEGPGASGGGKYLTASTDGSRVFFKDESQLTSDSTASNENPDLYEYSRAARKLTDLSVDSEVGGHADVLGVVGASEDGSYVYFVARGALASGAVAGGFNMYVAHAGSLEFIAALSEEDENDRSLYKERNGRFGDWSAIAGIRTADVTPSGHLVAFLSVNKLTEYQNEGKTEVFIYNAMTNVLSCASCNPTGAKPAGFSALPVTNYTSDPPRWLSETEGGGERLFFDSQDALVPWDTNGQMDVYEYENGALSLISAGTGDYESGIASVSEGGNDVFFTTSDRLVEQDKDEFVDLYDARVGGGFPETPTPAECSEVSTCRGPGQPVASALGVPSSAQLQGAGNLVPPAPAVTPRKTAGELRAEKLRKALKLCKAKRHKLARVTCEVVARHRYGPPTTRKARKGHKR